MKKLAILLPLVLSGCVQVGHYQGIVKTPPPESLRGYWQNINSHGLVSKQATGSLIIDAEGNTLDCRQWQRVIVKPGKVALLSHRYVNVNQALRVMPLKLEREILYYDGMQLKKVTQLTTECQSALEANTNRLASDIVTPSN